MAIDFNVDAARKAGYSDTEIADELSKKAKFNADAARKAGYSDAEIVSHLTGKPAQIDTKAASNAAQDKLAHDTSASQAILIGMGRTGDRIVKGARQVWDAATGDKEHAAKLKAEAASDDAAYAHLTKAHPVATSAGESIPAVAIPVGGVSATAMGTAVKLGGTAAAMKAAEYGTVGERAKGAALAGAGGVVGGVVVPKAVGLAVNGIKSGLRGLAGNITPEAIKLYERAKQLGIPVNVAQLGDSKFLKVLASSLEQVPLTGGAKAASQQRTAFTNAVSKTFGDNVTKVTPAVYAANKARLGQQFNDLTSRNTLHLDQHAQSAIEKIAQDAVATGDDGTNKAVQNILGRLDEQGSATGGNVPAKTSTIVGPNGQPIVTAPASSTPSVVKVAGTTYQSIDTQLGNMIKAGGEKAHFAKRLQTELRAAMDKSIVPADQQAWQQARSQYRNLKAVRDIVAKDMGNGDIPPTALSNALNSTEAGKEAMAMGKRGDLGDLSQVGRQFVRDQVPNSGTAQRTIAMSLLGAGVTTGGLHGLTGAAALLAGGATSGRVIQKIMSSPKTIEFVRRQGISMSQLAKMPPARLAQFLGGLAGEAKTDKQPKDQ